MNKVINFGLLGCGRIAPKHLESLRELSKVARCTAVCDIDKARASSTGEKWGIPWFTSLGAMLDAHPEIDVVSVLTPSGNHCDHTVEIAKRKKHVVVEKPMALSIDDAERMIRACDSAGVRLFVVKQNRYNIPVKRLREAVISGRFGKIVLGTVRVRWCRTQSYYDQDAWRGTWAQDGGVLCNQASHHIDLLTWMLGEIDSVFAYTATRLVDIEVDDTAVAVLKFRNGALGVIEATTATRPRDLEGSISILGERGSVEIAGFAVNEMRTWQFADSLESEDEIKRFRENPPNVYGFGHTRFLDDVISCIRSGRGGAVDGLEGMKSLILVNAMYESMETGQEVKLRFRPSHVRLGVRDTT